MFPSHNPWLLAPHAYQALASQTLDSTAPRISAKYIPAINKYNGSTLSVENDIAILPIHGVLLRRLGPFDEMDGVTSYEAVEKNLTAALENPAIKGVLLDIDSPGGEASGLFDLADSIYHARSHKPIWAIVSGTAYSAAYALASSAGKVYTTSTGSVGSIGVIASHIDQSAYNERKGFKVTSITAGAHKNDYSPHQPLSLEAEHALQAEVNRLYDMFVDLVARNRSLSTNHIRATEAALFYGEEALKQGLADGVLCLNETVQSMQAHLSDSSPFSSPPLPRKDKSMTNIKKPNASQELAAELQIQEGQASDVERHQKVEMGTRGEDAPCNPSPPGTFSAQDTPYTHAEPPASLKAMPDRQALIESAEQRGRETYRTQALEIVELCTLACKPEHIGPFLKQNMSVDAARETLLADLAASSQNAIYSYTMPPGSQPESNWVVQEAQSRAAKEGK
jgi:signal peptide peptidase SppA